jgi:polysaccharide export outer membrane protein
MQSIPNVLLRHCLRLALLFCVLPFNQNVIAQSDTPQSPGHHDSRIALSQESGTISVPSIAPAEKGASETTSPALVLGPGDELEVTVYGAPDLSTHARVSADGNISMPLVGYIHVAGLSSSEAEGTIESQLLKENILNAPQVSVYVKDYTSSGISVAGEVTRPGFYSALGPHRLFDILQMSGGLSERASGAVTVTHRGDENNPVRLEVSQNPAEMAHNNIELHPGDTVFVAKAAMVYVLGEVNKPGGYILNSTGAVTVLQVVAAAGGPTHAAAVGGTKMIRRTPSGLQELPVPLKALLHGKGADVPISADDILFIPSSRMKSVVAASTIVATGTATAAIYRVF